MSLAVSTPSLESLTLNSQCDHLAQWDQLWCAAAHGLPTMRGDCLSLFLATFAKSQRFETACVHDQGDLIAALPMVIRVRCGISVASLPLNPWMKCGDLMASKSRCNKRDFDELADKALATGAWLLDFSWACETQAWCQFVEALQRRGCYVDRRHMFDVGTIAVEGDWDTYWSSRSSNHRKQMRSNLRKLEQVGNVTFDRHRHIADDTALGQLMSEAFFVENLGWKGNENSSVRSHPAIERFYRSAGTYLNESGMLELQFLRVDGRPIAFEWGYLDQGVYHSHKVGFDPEFARYSPGQLLLYKQLQCWFAGNEVHQVDTMGILSEATARWTNGQYSLNRYRVSGSGLIPRLAWRSLCHAHAFLKSFRKKS